jgi:hypothetical protein
MKIPKTRIIAFYLPQFHQIPENDRWWGRGFTEWTNVRKAKPLFPGHYQPRVPADLGYYDLNSPEIRQAQADMAQKYGIEGFCYWHYWFGNGRRLLERPFNEVLSSGKPDFPFCLAWANNSWKDNQFSDGSGCKLLMEQLYPGEKDYKEHFLALLPAFKDKRYIRVDDKPLFMIYAPSRHPQLTEFITLWQKLAGENGLKGIHFVARTHNAGDIDVLLKKGLDAVNLIRLFHFSGCESLFGIKLTKLIRTVFRIKISQIFDYRKYCKYCTGEEDYSDFCYPSIVSNWDNSPRYGKDGSLFINSSPRIFKKVVKAVLDTVKEKPPERRIVILNCWNEWAEGCYVEPDLKYGRGYLEALKEAIAEAVSRENRCA